LSPSEGFRKFLPISSQFTSEHAAITALGVATSLRRDDAPGSALGHRGTMIEVTSLTKRYGETVAVDDLSFTVRPGIVTGFLGPNGAGKSTTMRMILGLDNPSRGHATVNGRPLAEHAAPLTELGVDEVPFQEYTDQRQVATRNALDVQVVDGRLRLYLVADDNHSNLLVYEAH
jgi:ABC-type oligopeptide transport system ATPase subunit